jgi:hypothetical protein
VFLEDSRIEIDNNLVENAIRPTAIGKKNYPSFLRICGLASLTHAAVAAGQGLFFGDAEAAERSAIFYTLIEACLMRQIDLWSYLRDVLTRLPSMTNQ